MKLTRVAITSLLLIVTACGPSLAWDLYYDGSVLPNAASLGNNAWIPWGDVSQCTTDGNILHLIAPTPVTRIFHKGCVSARWHARHP